MSFHRPRDSMQEPPVSGPEAHTLAAGDIRITRTFHEASSAERSAPIVCGEAFNVIVQLRDLKHHRIWRGGELVFDGERETGSLYIADLRQKWQCQYLSPFDNIRFYIPFSRLREFADEMGRPDYRGLSCSERKTDEVMLGLARALLPSFQHPKQAHPLFLEQINLAILAHLTHKYGGLHFPIGKKGGLAPWQQKRATEFLVAHVSDAFSIVELASACDLSRSYFIKAFKESFGLTPHRWLTEYRVTRAKELLLLDMPIAEIAIACGFADQSHLTRVFSEIAGLSPGRFRRRDTPAR